MNLTVIGLGYVGLTISVVFGSFYHDVIGYDINKEKVASLKEGISPTEEPGIQILLNEAKSHLRFTSNAKDAIRPNNIIAICVDTPVGDDGKINLTNFYAALDSIAENAIQDCFVIINSTVPPGTNRAAKKYLESHSKYKFDVISNPEFITQGKVVKDFVQPSRIVIGAETKEAEKLMRDLIDTIIDHKIPILVTTPENAEIIKYASNAYLALRIGYINEISRICDVYGGDIEKVAIGMGLDPRIGTNYLKPSLGFGGSCLPKDVKAIINYDHISDCELSIIPSIVKSNENQINHFVDKVFKRFKSITHFKVAVLGLSFKGGTEDTRNSPSIPIVRALLEKYAEVYAYDPAAEENFKKNFLCHTHIHYCETIESALKKADCCLILTDDKEFKELTTKDFDVMSNKVVFDGRNIFKEDSLPGIEYHSVGRRIVK